MLNYSNAVHLEPVEGHLAWFDKLTRTGENLSFLEFKIIKLINLQSSIFNSKREEML